MYNKSLFYDWSSHITRNDIFNVWQELLSYLDNLSFSWKTTFLELYNRAKKVYKINISKTGSKITIASEEHNESIENFSFRIDGELEQSENNTSNVLFEKETNIVTVKHILLKSKIILYTKR